MLAMLLPIEDPERALSLCDEAIEVGHRIGDPMAVAAAMQNKGAIAAQRSEWHTALHSSLNAAEQWLQLGSLTTIFWSCYTAGVALCGLGYYEPAAVLIGKADALIPQRFGPDWMLDMLASTDAALINALGEQHALTLAARGAGLETTAVVAYLRTAADQPLPTP